MSYSIWLNAAIKEQPNFQGSDFIAVSWDLGTLRIARLIVHEVPQRPSAGGSGGGPVLSEVDRRFAQEVRNYFRERIVDSLTRAAVDAVEDPDTESPIPGLSRDILARPSTFVRSSQAVAQHLYVSQNAVNNPGLLCVASGQIEELDCVCVLKLEKEEGVRVRQDRVNGQFTFDMEHLRDLMLTKKTRVFKIGLIAPQAPGHENLLAAVSDVQASTTPSHHVADFFLNRFLGFRMAEEADVITERLYRTAQEFINEQVDDAADKGRYEVALIAELQSNRTEFRPSTFAGESLRTQHRRPFLDAIAASGLATARIPKDASRIASTLKRIQVRFQNGVAILAAPDVFQDQVHMSDLPNGRTRATIEDVLRDIRTRG